MQFVQIGKFKSELPAILEKVQNLGESFTIEYGKKHKKVAMLVPYKEEKKARIFGQLEGKIDIADNFNDENEEINQMFYNSNI